MKRVVIFTFLFFLSSLVIAADNNSGIDIEWSYKGNSGPARWGELSNDFVLCATGKMQSPININKNKTKKLKQDPYALHINYVPEHLTILDDGETKLTIGQTHTILNDGHTIQVNTDEHVKETVEFNHDTYKLLQFHFHSPSESYFQGESSPLEIHFVHQGPNGKVLVIGVLVKEGTDNSTLQTITDHLPMKTNDVEELNDKIDPQYLLPNVKNYFSFMGSLTTPPCTEGLQWIMMENSITASPAQLMQIRKGIGGDNARPTQPKNKRQILYIMEK